MAAKEKLRDRSRRAPRALRLLRHLGATRTPLCPASRHILYVGLTPGPSCAHWPGDAYACGSRIDARFMQTSVDRSSAGSAKKKRGCARRADEDARACMRKTRNAATLLESPSLHSKRTCIRFAVLKFFHQRCSRLTYTSLQARAAAQKRRVPSFRICASSIRSPPLHQERPSPLAHQAVNTAAL